MTRPKLNIGHMALVHDVFCSKIQEAGASSPRGQALVDALDALWEDYRASKAAFAAARAAKRRR